jgi:hypothetical protein
MNLKIRPLTQAIGAEILDFDARNIAPGAARARVTIADAIAPQH